MFTWTRWAAVLVAAPAVAIAGCASASSAPKTHKTVAASAARPATGTTVDVGQRPGTPVAPSARPPHSGSLSRPLCRDVSELTGLQVARENSLPQNHISFTFPARVSVTSPAAVQAVARDLCGLPVDTLVNCPADFGVSYQLSFSPASLHLAPVQADPTGCWDITGLGTPARSALPRFWRTLGTAMHLLRPNESSADIYRLFAGHLPS